MIYDLAILGAGAAGLFLAANIRKKAILIDHNQQIGRKILISGGGKANIGNLRFDVDRFYSRDPAFVKHVIDRFDNKSVLYWLKKEGCKGFLQKEEKLFCPRSAKELINIFQRRLHCEVMLGARIDRVEPGFTIYTSKGTIKAKKVVVATGGLSYKRIGATGIGYEIAKSFGHEVSRLDPALVGFTVQKEQFWFKELSGISFKVRVKVGEKSFHDDILFAHRGISGPAILNASLYWQRGKVEIAFLKKNIKYYLKNKNKVISSQLPLPKRFTKRFLQELGIEDRPIKKLSSEEVRKLAVFNNYIFAPAGTFGFERAEVTRGGVLLDDIDPDTMESRKYPGLYFIGEVLDVAGELGGYNFQWAFSSAWVAKEAIDGLS